MLLLILVSAATFAGRSTADAQVVTLRPTQPAGGAATVTAGDDITYILTLANGTANPITDVDAGTAPDIRFVAGNRKLTIVQTTIVNDKCDLLALAAGGTCTFGVRVSTYDQAPGMGGLTADYTVTWGVSYNNDSDSVETTLKTHIVAPVFVPEPRTWILLIMGATPLFLARRRNRTLRMAEPVRLDRSTPSLRPGRT